MLAGLPYVLWPVGSVFILATRKKDDPFLHYHAIQGLLWGAAALVLSVAGFLSLGLLFRVMPGSSTYLPGVIGMGLLFGGGVIAMVVFFTALFLAWRATAGEMLRLPLAGDFAEQRMLDHTGMTRRDFMEMLERSFIEPNFDEPEPIPFPEKAAPVLHPRAQEVLAQRAVRETTTPASVKAVDLLAQRQAQHAQAKAEEARAKAEEAKRQAALAEQQRAAALQAQQAAALQAAQRGAQTQPPTERRPASSPAAKVPSPPLAQSARPEPGRAKSYSLIGDKVSTPAEAPVVGPRAGQAGSGATASAPKVKDVDLVRHYKERGKTSPTNDALKGWLNSVDGE